jgi:ubiquitin carboxyl-terminal hydrolase 8
MARDLKEEHASLMSDKVAFEKMASIKKQLRKRFDEHKDKMDKAAPAPVVASISAPPGASVSAQKADRVTMNTPTVIATERLYDYLTQGKVQRILIIDLRTKEQFINGHILGYPLVNLEPELLTEGVTSPELEKLIRADPPFHQKNFAGRHEDELVIYMDESSSSPDQTVVLTRFVQAVKDFELVKILKRNPALLVGGYQAWKQTLSTSPMRSDKALIGFGDTEIEAQIDYSHLKPSGPSFNAGAVDYLQNSALGSVNSAHNKALPRAPQSSNFQTASVASILARVNSSNSNIFDNPFHNFVTQQHADTFTNQSMPYVGSYYPDANISGPTAPPLVDLNLPNHLSHDLSPATQLQTSIPMMLPTVPQQYQPGLPPPLSQPPAIVTDIRRDSAKALHRAPSPPSPGAATVTIHTLPEELDWNIQSSITGFCGLKNLGNTCYMNSTLQCLIATRPLSIYFLDGRYRKHINTSNPMGNNGRLAQGFSQLLGAIIREEGGSLNPSSFREVATSIGTQFKGHDQHDSQEFLAWLLDGLHEDLNQGLGNFVSEHHFLFLAVRGGRGKSLRELPDFARIKRSSKEEEAEEDRMPEEQLQIRSWAKYLLRNDSLIVDLFQGQLRSELKCLTCGKSSVSFNTFMYLSVPIPQVKGTPKLSDCLKEFTKQEYLSEADAWKCPQCKVPRRASKTLSIARLPPILLVHLKRFSFQGPFKDKLDTFVDFPVKNLDVFPYLSPTLRREFLPYYDNTNTGTKPPPIMKYDLYAVSNHYGGLNGGHYTAYIRQTTQRRWYHFDDSRISELCSMDSGQDDKVKTKNAYTLYYVTWAMS